MSIFKKIALIILLLFYVTLSAVMWLLTIKLISNCKQFNADAIIVIIVGLGAIGSIIDIIPEWFRENFWFCNHCKKFRWLITKYENNNEVHKACEKCHNEINIIKYK